MSKNLQCRQQDHLRVRRGSALCAFHCDQPLQLSNLSYVSLDDDGDGFTITYDSGTNTTDCPDGLFSTLVFTCNKDAVWNFDPNINLSNITQFITAEPTFKDCEVCLLLSLSLSSLTSFFSCKSAHLHYYYYSQ